MMKIAPIAAELRRRGDEFEHVLVHTDQHYDRELSEIFLEELGVGDPDYSLGVGSGSHAQQAARVMERLEPVLLEAEPDVVLVPGDVNSTMAAALTASKLVLPIGHVEAGLRSFDRSLPEEINRIVADQLSQLLFIHSPEARDNLLAEGCAEADIHDVGNTMIDSLVAMRPRIESYGAPEAHGLERGAYLVVTLHRHWVDGQFLADALARLTEVAEELPVVFPVHPRTRAAMVALGIEAGSERLRLLEPVGYVEFMSLVAGSAGVLTDSGGIQEETTFLGLAVLHAPPQHRAAGDHGRARRHERRPRRGARADRRGSGAPSRGRRQGDAGAAALGRQSAAARVVDVLERFPLEEPVVARSG